MVLVRVEALEDVARAPRERLVGADEVGDPPRSSLGTCLCNFRSSRRSVTCAASVVSHPGVTLFISQLQKIYPVRPVRSPAGCRAPVQWQPTVEPGEELSSQ